MEKKKRDYEIRQQRIANGMCSTLDCDAQAGINKTNKQVSRYCDPCKARIQERKKPDEFSPSLLLGDKPKRPAPVDPDEETRGYLDSREFIAHTLRVKAAIEAIEKIDLAATVPAIKRHDETISAVWLMDSLESLRGVGEIGQYQCGALQAYRSTNAPVTAKKRGNIHPARPASKTRPHPMKWSRNVTA